MLSSTHKGTLAYSDDSPSARSLFFCQKQSAGSYALLFIIDQWGAHGRMFNVIDGDAHSVEVWSDVWHAAHSNQLMTRESLS